MYDNTLEVMRDRAGPKGSGVDFLANYTGARCPVCNKRFTDNDDIVVCPVCGAPMSMNLRADDTFVEDEGWHTAARRYEEYLQGHEGQHILFLELGVGGNTPVIIKYPFWRMTLANPRAVYACINLDQAYCPPEIESRSLCIGKDIGEVLTALL